MARKVAALVLALGITTVPAPATADGDGVPVFHDRVAKRDKVGDVKGDGSRPVDIRRIVVDHYLTGTKERLVLTARFTTPVTNEFEVQWLLATTGDYVNIVWDVGGGVEVLRDGERASARGIRHSVDGRVATLIVPWPRLGSPRTVRQTTLLATYGIDGLDTVRTKRDLH